jgi:hypothetical protein
MSQTRSYSQLAAFVQSQAGAFLQSPLCVYALLHAVQLRDTLSDEQLGKGSLDTEDKVLAQMEMVRAAAAAAAAALALLFVWCLYVAGLCQALQQQRTTCFW